MYKFILLFLSLTLSAQVTKVEPPFWWEDMHNSSLMITLYGDDLAHYDVKSESLKITDVVRLESHNYLFVYVDLANTNSGDYSLPPHL